RHQLMTEDSVLQGIYATLESLTAQRASSRFLRYVARTELLGSIAEQSGNLETYIQYFNTRSAIAIRLGLGANSDQPSLNAPSLSRHIIKRSIPPPPKLYGRDNEVDALLDLLAISSPKQVHLAILGPGVSTFGDKRFFLPCDTTPSLDLLIHELATTLDIGVDRLSAQLLQSILTQLGEQRTLLVLDNFETLWDPLHSRSEVEGFLAGLTSIPTVNLLITIRGSQHPAGVEWSQLLPPLRPLELQFAEMLFHNISHKLVNTYAVDLIKAVNCVPLAVTLVAHLAAVHDITVESLWERWIEEKTMMIERGSGRLANLDASIRLSLNSPRMNHDPNALSFLSIVALLPGGMSPHLFRSCDSHLLEIINVKRAITTLRQNALIYEDADKMLRMLNPIRQFVLSHHPPSDIAYVFIEEYFIQLALLGGEHPLSVHSQLRQEIGNIEAILVKALGSDRPTVDVVAAILALAEYTYISGVGTCTPLERAVKRLEVLVRSKSRPQKQERNILRRFLLGRAGKAVGQEGNGDIEDNMVTLRADCLGCWGQLLSRQGHYQDAKDKFELALELHRQQEDFAGEAADLHNIGCLLTLDDALQKFTAALQLHERIRDQAGVAYDMIGLGQVYLQRRQLLKAEEVFTTALRVFNELGKDEEDPLGRVTALNNVGHTLTAWNKFPEAEVSFNQAIQENETIRDVVCKADSLCGLASTLLLRSRWSEAEGKIREAMALRESFKDPDLFHVLGRIQCAQWKLTEAIQTFQYTRTLPRDPKDDYGRGDDLKYLAFTFLLLGRLNEAEAMLHDVKVLYNSAENVVGLAEVDITKAEIWAVQGKLDEAEVAVKEAVDVMNNRDCKIGNAYALYVLGGVQLLKGLFHEARMSVQLALELHKEIGSIQGQADDVGRLAEIALQETAGRDARARWDGSTADDVLLDIEIEKGVAEAKALHEAIDDIAGLGDDWYLAALIAIKRQNFVRAESAVRTALEKHYTADVVYKQARDYHLLGRVLKSQGRMEEGTQATDLAMSMYEGIGVGEACLQFQQLLAALMKD
ncbi:hypothetical protein AN958_00730, partial [Leucoagaricus sp. SymC.cos]